MKNYCESLREYQILKHQHASNGNGSRTSLRFTEHASPHVSLTNTDRLLYILFNLNSRKLRQYIIEDVMYIEPGEDILILICEDSIDFLLEENTGC